MGLAYSVMMVCNASLSDYSLVTSKELALSDASIVGLEFESCEWPWVEQPSLTLQSQ